VTNKIDFLNEYSLSSSSVEIVTDESQIVEAPIPNFWKEALLSDSLEERKEKILSVWKEYSSSDLRNTISYLGDYLKNIDLICLDGEYSLLYTILTYQTGEEIYYEGKQPVTVEVLKQKFGENTPTIKQSIADFYTYIHNGFYDYTSKSMGIDNLKNVNSMADYDWEYLQQLDIDLIPLYNFFSNGMGEYVVLDIENGNTYLWSSRELPKRQSDFWALVDEWIIIGLDF
jgi:hypothetical protein